MASGDSKPTGIEVLQNELDRLVQYDQERYDYEVLMKGYPTLVGLEFVKSASERWKGNEFSDQEALIGAINDLLDQAREANASEVRDLLGGWSAETAGLPYQGRLNYCRDKYFIKNIKGWKKGWLLPFAYAVLRLEREVRRQGLPPAGEDPAPSWEDDLNEVAEAAVAEFLADLEAEPDNFPLIDLDVVPVSADPLSRIPLSTTLADWLASDSNLAVLYGPAGSGKRTESLRHLTELAPAARRCLLPLSFKRLIPWNHVASNERELVGGPAGLSLLISSDLFAGSTDLGMRAIHLNENLGDMCVVIDDFEACVAADGSQCSPPDLSDIADLLSPDAKILLLTSRAPHNEDNLTAQMLRVPPPCGALAPKAWVLQWPSPDQIQQVLEGDDLREVLSVTQRALFDRIVKSDVPGLRGPRFLQMLYRLAARPDTDDVNAIDQAEGRFTLAQIVEHYVNAVLSRPTDIGDSCILPPLKRDILQQVAWETFRRVGDLSYVTTLAVERTLVEAIVMEAVVQMRSLTKVSSNSSFKEHNWTQDFWSTTHLLRPTLDTHVTAIYEFESPVIYDFFLAERILARFSSRQTLGIEDRPETEESQISSLVLYFTKQRVSIDTQLLLRDVATRPSVSNYDRLLMIYLLEDDPEVADVLDAAPSPYRTFLYEQQASLRTVLARVVRYQIILLERSETRAFDFIDWLDHEEREHREPEGQWPAFIEPHEPFLLRRLANPALRPARPLTVHRLSQLGTAPSLPHLNQLLNEDLSDPLRDITIRALDAIHARETGER